MLEKPIIPYGIYPYMNAKDGVEKNQNVLLQVSVLPSIQAQVLPDKKQFVCYKMERKQQIQQQNPCEL